MPVSAVKYEDLWVRAKDIVGKNYPQVKKGGPKYWKLVMGVYKIMERKRDAQK